MTIALRNLIDNASKFSNDQEVLISIRANTRSLDLIISDRGIGIPGEEIKKIMEPFYRAANARSFKGFGVGLPLAHRIILLHGGRLHISSELQKGTTVVISFERRQKLR